MKRPIFITGIGTGVGKTVIAATVTEALKADYWKPIQAGFEDGTDALTVKELVSDDIVVHPEVYKLSLPASPHIAAKEENIQIEIDSIVSAFNSIQSDNSIVIEGAGGLLVPINDQETIADIILALNARVIIVSRNYLGSINHSLLTAEYCKSKNIDVLGWIFNDQFMNYEEDIVRMSGIASLGSIPSGKVDKSFILSQSQKLKASLQSLL
jgi:dethiobiotin synthetase